MSSVGDRLAEIAGQIGEIGAQLSELQEAVEASRSSLDEMPEGPAAPPQPAAAGGQLDVDFVNQALRKLAYGKTQERILEILLEEAQPSVSRAILFLLRDGQYVTWKGFGFDPANIKEIALDDPADSVVRAAQQRQLIYRRDRAADSLPWLSQAGDLPDCTLCIPLVFENSAPLVFYADSDDPIPIDSLELLTQLTVLVLKNNYLHQLVNAQKEAAGQAGVLEQAAAASHAVEEAPAEEPFEEDQQEAWQEAEESQPEPVEAEAEAPSEEWMEAGAEEESFEEVQPADTDFEPAAQEAAPEEPQAEEEPYEEPSLDFSIPSEKKEIDFDEELAAAEREIDFDIDLDAAPEIEDWEAEESREGQQEFAEPPSDFDETVKVEAEEPQEDLEFQPFGETPQAEPEPQEEAWQAEPAEEWDAEPEPAQQAEPADLEAEPYALEPEQPSPQAEEPAFPQAEEPAFEAAPQDEGEFEPQPELEATPQEASQAEPELQEAAEAQPAEEAAPPSEEDKKAHDEARRFARLLVSEIKLYNEDEVEAGRQNGNLYQRLSRDINRSRDMYQKRVNSSVSHSVDYFHDEVVRILAKGDAGLLGGDYPGPQTGE